MKTITHFKKASALLFMLLLMSITTFAQDDENCEDFNESAGNWRRSNINTGGLINQLVNATNTIAGASGMAGDNGLRGDDTSGSTILFNESRYRGNLAAKGNCLCYDFLVIDNAQGQTANPRITIYQGTAGTSPRVFTKSASFVYNQAIDETNGWVRICAPIELAVNGVLPSNSEGTWVQPVGQTAADFNDVVTNASGIYFNLDLNSDPSERYGYDNICLEDCPDEGTDEGSFCCDESENLVQNGNFEYGNTGFSSDYDQDTATLPGQYDVTTSATAFGAAITDHSFCEDPTLYSTNDNYLLVNGKTTQAPGAQSAVWSTSLNLEAEKEYRFCANFKNMPQCTFDILPQIEIVTSSGFSETATIDVDPNDPCAWQSISFCFTGEEDMDFSIILKEDGLGDGNDLAIDDIAVSELVDANLSITVQHQGNPQIVTGSLNTIATIDDVLPYDREICDEPWFWFVFTVDSFNGGTATIDFSQPYGWGNDISGYSLFNPTASGATPWNITTTFDNFPFAQQTMYVVGMQTRSCCEDCVDDGLTYQLIYNDGLLPIDTLTQDDIDKITSILGTYGSGIQTSTAAETNSVSANLLQIFPNPANNQVTVALLESEINTINIYTLSGQFISKTNSPFNSRSQQIDISGLTTGVYMIKVETTDNQTMTSRLIVE